MNNNDADLSERAYARMLMAVFASLVAVLLLLSGCSSGATLETEEEPKTASQYMVELNDYSGKLADKMQEFSEAASAGRISAMQTKVQEAYAILDEMTNLEAPDDISDIKNGYNDAISQFKSALNDYIALFTEIYDSSDTGSFDYSTYSQRLEDVQKQYDSALGSLEDADKKASEM